MNEINIKWVAQGGKYFKTTATVGEYELVVSSFEWAIFKNNIMVECYLWHCPPPTIDHTNMRVQCERKFKLMNL